jgi:hypothetical protein
MNAKYARGLLDRTDVLRHPSDLVELACTPEGRPAAGRPLTCRPPASEAMETDD